MQINEFLNRENQKNPFVAKFIQLAGMPKWDKSFLLGKNNLKQQINSRSVSFNSTYIIPVVNENNRVVTGAIIVQVGDTTSYHLALLKDYKSHNTSQSVFMKAMMVLDAKVYGYSKFKIEDTIALSNTKEVYFSINTTSSNTIKKGLLNTDDPCDIIEIWYNPDGDHCN